MSMNKKLYNRIKKLNDEGLDTTTTIKLFITMAKNPEDAAEAISECLLENSGGWDYHTIVASIIFDKGMHDITPEEREEAKKRNHAKNYGREITKHDPTPCAE